MIVNHSTSKLQIKVVELIFCNTTWFRFVLFNQTSPPLLVSWQNATFTWKMCLQQDFRKEINCWNALFRCLNQMKSKKVNLKNWITNIFFLQLLLFYWCFFSLHLYLHKLKTSFLEFWKFCKYFCYIVLHTYMYKMWPFFCNALSAWPVSSGGCLCPFLFIFGLISSIGVYWCKPILL